MSELRPSANLPDDSFTDYVLQQQALRLYRVTLHLRWMTVGLLCLLVAPLSLWGLRHEFHLWFDYFTWTAIRYSLIYNPLSAIGLITCVCLTISTAIWQLRNALFGISPQYLNRLQRRVMRIRQGNRGWLWKRVCQ